MPPKSPIRVALSFRPRPRGIAGNFALVSLPPALIWFGTPSAVGWVFDQYGTYQPAWLVLAVLTLIGLPLVFTLRPPKSP